MHFFFGVLGGGRRRKHIHAFLPTALVFTIISLWFYLFQTKLMTVILFSLSDLKDVTCGAFLMPCLIIRLAMGAVGSCALPTARRSGPKSRSKQKVVYHWVWAWVCGCGCGCESGCGCGYWYGCVGVGVDADGDRWVIGGCGVGWVWEWLWVLVCGCVGVVVGGCAGIVVYVCG